MSDIDRREFAKYLTGGLAAGLASEAATRAEEPEKKPPSLPVLVLARIMEEFPSDKYDDKTIEGILSDIRGDLARGRELSAFPLKNSDEPAFVFPADHRGHLVASFRGAK